MADEELDPRRTARLAAEVARDNRAHRAFVLMAALALVGVLAVAGGLWLLKMRGDQLAAQQADAAVAAQRLAGQVQALGATPIVSPPTPVAPVTGAQGPRGAQGPGPSQQQIDDAVAAYLAVHPPAPGKDATAEQVAAAAGAYLSAHPPQPGRPPTAEEIAGAVSTYCSTHGGCAGPAGRSATDSQVAQAVAAYCGQEPSPCAGPVGADGPSGPPGPTGATGPPGSPPAGWTYSDALGVQHTCTRNNDDDSSPTYNCS